MSIEIKAPTLPESVPDGTIATWYKNVGDSVARDELLVDIETDKVVIEVVSPTDGTLKEILKDSGETIVSNEAIGSIEAGEAAPAPKAESAPEPEAKSEPAPEEASASADDADGAAPGGYLCARRGGDARRRQGGRRVVGQVGLPTHCGWDPAVGGGEGAPDEP